MWLCSRACTRIIIQLNHIKQANHILCGKMSSSHAIEYLESNSAVAKQLISSVEEQIAQAKKSLALQNWDLQKKNIQAENEALVAEIAKWKNRLIQLEIEHGIPQVPLPSSSTGTVAPPNDVAPVKAVPQVPEQKPAQQKPSGNEEAKVEKKKKDKPAEGKKAKGGGGGAPSGGAEEPPVDVGRLDFRVGRIVSAKKHPDADSLYVEEVDVGEERMRTVVSGLVKFVPMEEMQGRMAVLLCNLKPAKMRGVTSEAMVMCASTPEKVEILSPPVGSVPGELVHVDGYPRLPDPVLNPKKKIFETVAPDLKTSAERVATYRGVALVVPGRGNVMAPSLVGVPIK